MVLKDERLEDLPRPLRALLSRAHPSALPGVLRLDLSRAQITALPNALTLFSSLTSLDLSANALETIPAEVAQLLPAVRVLNLSSNRLASLDEIRRLGALDCLEELDLRRNPHPFQTQRGCMLQALLLPHAGDDAGHAQPRREHFLRLRVLDGRVVSADDERLALEQVSLDRLLRGTSLALRTSHCGVEKSLAAPTVEAGYEPWRQRLLEVQRTQLISRLGELRDLRESQLQDRLRTLVLYGHLPTGEGSHADDGGADGDSAEEDASSEGDGALSSSDPCGDDDSGAGSGRSGADDSEGGAPSGAGTPQGGEEGGDSLMPGGEADSIGAGGRPDESALADDHGDGMCDDGAGSADEGSGSDAGGTHADAASVLEQSRLQWTSCSNVNGAWFSYGNTTRSSRD